LIQRARVSAFLAEVIKNDSSAILIGGRTIWIQTRIATTVTGLLSKRMKSSLLCWNWNR